jgi:integrase
VLKVLEPIWQTKVETASRLRGRIEAVLDWAVARDFRGKGDNPARWKGHLDQLLPASSKVRRVEHHAALPYQELPTFLEKLRLRDGVAARALEFLILTAARTGEVIGAPPNEVDINSALWIVPPDRMKARKEHRVPLSARAVEIVTEASKAGATYLFAGGRRGKPLSNMALLAVLKRMGRTDLPAHGFRSTFQDWAAEVTDHHDDVVEMALAHAIGSKVEAAYRRGDLMEKRRRLMDDWAEFCCRPIENAVPG